MYNNGYVYFGKFSADGGKGCCPVLDQHHMQGGGGGGGEIFVVDRHVYEIYVISACCSLIANNPVLNI